MCPSQPSCPQALIIDDDPTSRAWLRLSLQPVDLHVEEVSCGEAAIDFAAGCMPDIVILDVQMPGMDGFAVCQRIHGLPGGEFVPILLMTGLDDVESIAKAYEVGERTLSSNRTVHSSSASEGDTCCAPAELSSLCEKVNLAWPKPNGSLN
jgi:CheY-like chemotaxis protein